MSNNKSTTLNQLIDVRLEKIKKIRDLGYNPYPYNFNKIHDLHCIIYKYIFETGHFCKNHTYRKKEEMKKCKSILGFKETKSK